MLALVAVVLVDGTVARASARVGEVAAHRALEEALAALARQHAVVLAGALVATDDALGGRQLESVDGAVLVGAMLWVGDRSDVGVLLRVRCVVVVAARRRRLLVVRVVQ